MGMCRSFGWRAAVLIPLFSFLFCFWGFGVLWNTDGVERHMGKAGQAYLGLSIPFSQFFSDFGPTTWLRSHFSLMSIQRNESTWFDDTISLMTGKYWDNDL